MENEEITVSIRVAITGYQDFMLKTDKTKEEVIKDFETKGIEMINDPENYCLESCEINHEMCSIDESKLPDIYIW